MRPAPQLPPETLDRKAPLPSIERRYRFLTWVFGGGVTVRDHEKHADAVTPIRGASVRGQLRFWWRACNPSRCTTLEELRKREGEIWGTTSQASQVDLTVFTQTAKPNTIQVYRINDRNRLETVGGMREIAYGAFPLQPSREALGTGARPWGLFDYGSSPFVLRLRVPNDFRADVEAALWAWETFGGLGGRTRRGFGAIAREDGNDTASVRSELEKYQNHPRIAGVPSLHQARFAVAPAPFRSALDAWKKGLGLLQTLRQGPNAGRNPPSRPQTPAGRSRWPEPDEIRRLTRKAAPRHSQPSVSVPRFPRAVFGMPIVFHFHPGSPDEPDSIGDPKMKNLQLQPRGEGCDRFASPLIVRPIPDGKGSFLAAALVLTSDVPDCELIADRNVFPVEWTLDPVLAGQIPALRRNGKAFDDPLQLFLEELEK